MAGNHAQASTESVHDFEAHQSTFRGFILLLEVGAGLSVLTLLLLYFFLAR